MNARGLDLTTADLLKNHVLRLSGFRFDQVKNNWQEMMERLNGLDASRFIRHYWNARHPFVREKDLYLDIRRKVTIQFRFIN